ncbi:MAG: hypothetical protein M3541_20645 [Acidobacteriota bacterium]|nr:hypothetical protein [Acidobacteriota bacterium]
MRLRRGAFRPRAGHGPAAPPKAPDDDYLSYVRRFADTLLRKAPPERLVNRLIELG